MPFSNISETTAVMVVAEELCQNLVDRSHGSPGPNGSDRSSAEFRFNPPFPRGFDSHGRPGPVQIQNLRSVRWDGSSAGCAGPSERAKRVDRSAFVRSFVRPAESPTPP